MLLAPHYPADTPIGTEKHLDEEMLLSTLYSDPVSHFSEEDGGEDLLISQQAYPPPSLFSHSSIGSSVTSVGYSLKRITPSDAATKSLGDAAVDPGFIHIMPCARRMMEATMRALLTGSIPTGRWYFQSRKTSRNTPPASFSRLFPGLFNPGFREVIHIPRLSNCYS